MSQSPVPPSPKPAPPPSPPPGARSPHPHSPERTLGGAAAPAPGAGGSASGGSPGKSNLGRPGTLQKTSSDVSLASSNGSLRVSMQQLQLEVGAAVTSSSNEKNTSKAREKEWKGAYVHACVCRHRTPSSSPTQRSSLDPLHSPALCVCAAMRRHRRPTRAAAAVTTSRWWCACGRCSLRNLPKGPSTWCRWRRTAQL